MFFGIFNVEWWAVPVIILIYTHMTIVAVTLYLHRSQAHKSIELSPIISHFFRFWLWTTTGMNTKEWIAIHRKHHVSVDRLGDPHSPAVFGVQEVLWKGAELYREASKDLSLIEQYGHGAPSDWIERKVYSAYRSAGVVAMFALNFLFFGFKGLTITAIQMCWIPFFAAGVVNGLGHKSGYRNFETYDNSTNLFPFGVLIGGEELHNNHHAFANSARFSIKPWELDIGWGYIRILKALKLVKVKSVYINNLIEKKDRQVFDESNAKAVVSNRLIIMSNYGQFVLKKVYREECQKLSGSALERLKYVRKILLKDKRRLTEIERSLLNLCLVSHAKLGTAYHFREKLNRLYEQRTAEVSSVIPLLKEWCQSAERTGVTALRDFAARLRTYSCIIGPG